MPLFAEDRGAAVHRRRPKGGTFASSPARRGAEARRDHCGARRSPAPRPWSWSSARSTPPPARSALGAENLHGAREASWLVAISDAVSQLENLDRNPARRVERAPAVVTSPRRGSGVDSRAPRRSVSPRGAGGSVVVPIAGLEGHGSGGLLADVTELAAPPGREPRPLARGGRGSHRPRTGAARESATKALELDGGSGRRGRPGKSGSLAGTAVAAVRSGRPAGWGVRRPLDGLSTPPAHWFDARSWPSRLEVGGGDDEAGGLEHWAAC